MRIAFYAPLKPPDHPVPSGDRLLARMFVAALQRAGHEITIPLRLRTWDGAGDAGRQQRIARIGRTRAARLIERWKRDPASAPELWFSYHVYHKAPDWTGPAVCQALRIPYVVAEGSVANKQRDGRWRDGHAAAVAAIRCADAVVCINPADVAGVASVRGPHAAPAQLAPFLDIDEFLASGATGDAAAAASLAQALPRDSPRLVTVAMMRSGDKLDSYRLLAAALARLAHRPWHLVIVGDGAARTEVEAAFATFAPGRIHFAGAQPRGAVCALLGGCDLFVWPAVAEPIGMVLLESQVCGVPVVAGRRPGIAAIVEHGVGGLLVPAGDASAFADAVERLLADSDERTAMGERARRYARANHDLPAAAAALDAIVVRAAIARKRIDAA
jgi:glycosyltransferase involved in cell wall biosynthesis